jgi:TonB family protein
MKPLVLLLVSLSGFAGEDPLRAERDVPRPERIHYVAAQYPPQLYGAMPVVMGLIVLDVELNEEGRPIDIKVLSGVPLLDREAIEAVRQWRYRPTVVDGIPRRVALIEVVDLSPSEGYRANYFVKMLNDAKAPKAYRLLALHRLREIGLGRKDVVKALEKAAKDPDEDIKGQATALLRSRPTHGN